MKELTITKIAKELIDGLEDFQDLKETENALKSYMEDNNLTLKELREKCWEDSSNIFDEISYYKG